MSTERQFASDNFLTPFLRRHRFAEAVWYRYKIWPMWPGSEPLLPRVEQDILSMSACAESIAYLDEHDADVGFPAGAINGVTVLEVRTEEAQDWLDALNVFETPRIWSPRARYYLFQYMASSELVPSERLVSGLSFLNDGDWIRFPGSMMDGQLVHWEVDPHYASPMPLPIALRNSTAQAIGA